MNQEDLKNSINQYTDQLKQINFALSQTENETEQDDLIKLKSDIEQLIELTEENLNKITENDQQASNLASTSKANDVLDDEYQLFMKEIEKEALNKTIKTKRDDIEDDLKSLEGMKCQAPHIHTWGDTNYHNALVCGVESSDEKLEFNEIKVRVMYTNPTHQEMLPCPYYLNGDCKFSEEKCKFSHGEAVQLSELREYKEPNFSNLKTGNRVLAKQSNNLWHRAILKKHSIDECLVKFESNQEETTVPLHDILPLDDDDDFDSSSSDSSNESDEEISNDWKIEKSLFTNPPSQKLGEWEKHTKGIGSKLMQQMGYIVGTGLGKKAEGRLEPVEAIILPTGKSLDHCMNLRENAGGDENLFSVERRLKKLQKQQEIRNQRIYEREKNKKNVFEFLNKSLKTENVTEDKAKSKSKHRQDIKNDSNRDLNIASLKIFEDIKKVELELYKIKESLTRHNNPDSAMNKNLTEKLFSKQRELQRLHDYSRNVSNEQNLRKDKKKMTVF